MTGLTPAGWLPDPNRRHELRYWDGAQWTDDVSDSGEVSKDPYDPATAAPPPPPQGETLTASSSSAAPAADVGGAMAPVAPPSTAAAVTSRDLQEEETTVWEGETENLQAVASKGKLVTARYRLTNQALYFETGVVTSQAETIVLASVTDAKVDQTMVQKVRGVGNVTVTYRDASATDQTRVIDSIRDPIALRDLILKNARYQAQRTERARRTFYGGLSPGPPNLS